MISSRKIPVITAALLCVCLAACGFIVYAAHTFDTTRITEYQKRLFSDEVAALDILMNGDDWQDLLKEAQSKQWFSCDLVINGEQFANVGIRTKGNSSLSQAMTQTGGRYSLQFKFNKYDKGQTYYGLDTFCINNGLGDATYMKDYLAYKIMESIGVATPLVNYANVTVNGEDYGFCLALERYDKAFLDRVYSTSAGQLYNVKIQMGMRGNFEDMWRDVQNANPDMQQGARNFGNFDPNGGVDFGNRGADFGANGGVDFGNRGGGMGMGAPGAFGSNGGGSLLYTDDNISSYNAIFDNAIFSSSSDKDKQRVITAIENLNTGTDLEKYFDVDEILRYLAAHTVVVNLDSYSSNMQQNYYIYERDGKITILPWDYGLSFGGFQSGNASTVVNFPIDTPVSGVNMEDRPLINMLLSVDEYNKRYHEYLRQIAEDYFMSGAFERTIRELDSKICGYVKNDPSSYYTYEQYEASLPELVKLGNLRAESILGQLDSVIPSTSAGQSADPSALTDTSEVNLSALGSMMGGGGMDQGGIPQGGRPGAQFGQGAQDGGIPQGGRPGAQFGQGGQDGGMPQGGRPGVPGGQDSLGGVGDAPASYGYRHIILLLALLMILAGSTIFIARKRKNEI